MRQPAEVVAARLAALGCSVHALAVVSERWHARRLADFTPTTARERAAERMTWRQAIAPWTDPETGIHVAPLSSGIEFSEEGSAMRHCVRWCVLQCLRDGTHVVSLRDEPDGLRLATAELVRTAGGGWICRQLRGRCNALYAIGTPVERALTAYLDAAGAADPTGAAWESYRLDAQRALAEIEQEAAAPERASVQGPDDGVLAVGRWVDADHAARGGEAAYRRLRARLGVWRSCPTLAAAVATARVGDQVAFLAAAVVAEVGRDSAAALAGEPAAGADSLVCPSDPPPSAWLKGWRWLSGRWRGPR